MTEAELEIFNAYSSEDYDPTQKWVIFLAIKDGIDPDTFVTPYKTYEELAEEYENLRRVKNENY